MNNEATQSSEKLVGLGGFEPPTSPLSGVRSNQLSYRPVSAINQVTCVGAPKIAFDSYIKGGDPAAGSPTATLLRLHPSHESQSGERPPKLDYPLLLQPTPMV